MQGFESGKMLELLVLLGAAAVAGGIVGLQREVTGKAAGLRTHMLVAVGTAFFMVISSGAGLTSEGLSRVIQGLATGIGFIGAGTILKLSDEKEIRGLTTAASLWVTAAIGVAAGTGLIWHALAGAVLTVMILAVVGWVEFRVQRRKESRP